MDINEIKRAEGKIIEKLNCSGIIMKNVFIKVGPVLNSKKDYVRISSPFCGDIGLAVPENFLEIKTRKEKEMKKILVTAGSTAIKIDQVRILVPWFEDMPEELAMTIKNIFSGRTGTSIAKYFADHGCLVTLITSSPNLIEEERKNLRVVKFKTFDQLAESMQAEISKTHYDVIIHSAAVSDYKAKNVLVKDEKGELVSIDSSNKVSSQLNTLYIEMDQTYKIVDQIRQWGFTGKLAKFKLEVGLSDEELVRVATKSMLHSGADYIVANCLEWMGDYAYIIDQESKPLKINRRDLPKRLWQKIHGGEI